MRFHIKSLRQTWIVVTLTVVLVLAFRFTKPALERFQRSTDDDTLENTQFWSGEETAAFLQNDVGWYVHSLSPLDLLARRAPSTHDYRRRAADAATSFTPSQRAALSRAVIRADAFFRSPAFCALRAPIVGIDILALPWIFALTTGDAYEDGLPHTRQGTIFLSTLNDWREPALTRILIHEKVHVYQRAYPNLVDTALHKMGWRVIQPSAETLARRRANPDRPERVMQHDGQIYIALYNSAKPRRITDAEAAHEDPYEDMAYSVAAAYK